MRICRQAMSAAAGTLRPNGARAASNWRPNEPIRLFLPSCPTYTGPGILGPEGRFDAKHASNASRPGVADESEKKKEGASALLLH